MAQIRHEINILCGTIGTSATSSEKVQLDTTQYNGTVTYYFETVSSTSSGTPSVSLKRVSGGTTDATVTVTGGTTHTLYRSTAFTPPAGQTEYNVVNPALTNTYAARIVVIQNFTTLTSAESQIEVCGTSGSTTTSTTAAPITNPKYWKYNSANWDGALTVYFEATIKAGNSKSGATASLQVADGTGDGFTGWADVSDSPVTTTTTANSVRVRSSSFLLTAGRNYRVALRTGTSKSAATIYNAKIVIQSGLTFANAYDGTIINTLILGGGSVAGENDAQEAQEFVQASGSLSQIVASFKKSNNPADNIYCEVVTALLDVSPIATSSSVSASTIAAGASPTDLTFTFSPAAAAPTGTYFIRFIRSGARDTSNYAIMPNGVSLDGVTAWRMDGGFNWNTSGVDLAFTLTFNAITKLEPQYLLANTLLAAGTGFQTFLTQWDSTEWSGVTNTYTGQAEAANGSTSVITIQEADGGSTLGTISSPDNAGTAVLTMPSDQNLDVKATTNNGDIYATRILVAVSIDAEAPPATSTVTDTPSNLVSGGVAISDSGSFSF